MTLETANRLVEYRKKHNLSQEEVAERIGVSRQAVSKWERVEASPDTDNLIALAQLYDVSLDELVLGRKPEEKPASDTITIENGSKTVVITGGSTDDPVFGSGEKGIHISVKTDDDDDDEDEDDDDDDGPARSSAHRFFRKFPFAVLTVFLYLVFGVTGVCGGWAFGWLVFLTVPLYYSGVEAIFKCNMNLFAFPVLVTMLYLIAGFAWTLWHPMWILFLLIPIYYCLGDLIRKRNK